MRRVARRVDWAVWWAAGKVGGCRGGGWGLGGHGWRLDVVWDGVGWGDV